MLQVSKLIHVKTINYTSSNKWERFPKYSGSQGLFEFLVARNITDAKLFNLCSAVTYKDTSLRLQVLWYNQFFGNQKGRES